MLSLLTANALLVPNRSLCVPTGSQAFVLPGVGFVYNYSQPVDFWRARKRWGATVKPDLSAQCALDGRGYFLTRPAALAWLIAWTGPARDDLNETDLYPPTRAVPAREVRVGDIYVDSSGPACVLAVERLIAHTRLTCRYIWEPDTSPTWPTDWHTNNKPLRIADRS